MSALEEAVLASYSPSEAGRRSILESSRKVRKENVLLVVYGGVDLLVREIHCTSVSFMGHSGPNQHLKKRTTRSDLDKTGCVGSE